MLPESTLDAAKVLIEDIAVVRENLVETDVDPVELAVNLADSAEQFVRIIGSRDAEIAQALDRLYDQQSDGEPTS